MMTPHPAGGWARYAMGLPRDKADTLLLLFSSVLVLAPHAAHLPPWVGAVAGATLLWRAALTVRGRRLPPLWLLLPVSVLAMAGVHATYGTLLGREAGVAMLALLLAFKLLEMRAKRDLFVVIFLSFFLLLTSFFYSQSIATALAMAATIIVLLTAQLSFQYTATVPSLARRLRLAAAIFASAAPLALVLVVAFPRIQGPLWGMPGDAHSGRSGMSDTMAPGNISSLAQSEEIAFRVRFTGAAPAQNKLYWRGIVLGNYDGRNWTRIGAQRHPRPVEIRLAGPALRYQVTLEPHGSRWIYALELPERIERLDRLDSDPIAASPEMELLVQNPIGERLRYDVTSVPDYRLQADESVEHVQQWLTLPAGFNPRAVAWAKTLQQGKPAASVNAVLKTFREDKFSYTLTPPLLGRDAVDEFLFTTKTGFCEHYAGAFVVLMRAMGIPARVVLGYQGGELNPIDGFLAVRQSDAHAWAEVWLARRGWVRVDPTAAVAPGRVEGNLFRALARRAPFGLEGLGYFINFQAGGNALLATLHFNINAVNNAWNQWVLDYNPERQRGFLHALDSAFGNWRSLLAGALTVALACLARALRARRRCDPVDALYLAFCRQQAKRGFARAPDEGPQRYAGRLAAMAARPEKKAAMARFLSIYGAVKYGITNSDKKAAAVKTLTRLLTQSR